MAFRDVVQQTQTNVVFLTFKLEQVEDPFKRSAKLLFRALLFFFKKQINQHFARQSLVRQKKSIIANYDI
jgi:hypothetical protein